MRKMKKVFWMLLLGLSVCLAGQQAEVLASERTPENKKSVQEKYVDLSDEIIQEGGFPKEADISENRAGASAEMTDTQRQVQNELTAAWDSFADSCDLTEYQITAGELREIYSETLNRFPKYFYVSGGYSYSYYSTFVSEVWVEYISKDKNELQQMRSAYDRAAASVVSKADDSWSDMEKALYINDYLARNCEYDEKLTKYTAYEALVNRTAVCQGYALAFMDLAHELGLSCEMVTSSSLNHAWDMVKIGDSYYHVDVTWNDPVEDRLGRARHWYFMKSSKFFKSEDGKHLKSDDWVMTGGIADKDASKETYDSYFWNASDAGFDYLGGYWYGFDGVDSICRYTCNGTDFTKEGSVEKIGDVWPVIDKPGYTWKDKYAGTGAFDGKFYYSGRDHVYELNLETGTGTPVFSLSEDQKKTGYIYGMHIHSSGELQYILSSSPNEPGNVYTAQKLSQTPRNDKYRIYFQGNGAASGSMESTPWIESGKEFRLPANQFTNGQDTFSGWNTKPDGSGKSYEDQAVVNREAAYEGEKFVLYAQWIRHVHTVVVDEEAVPAMCTTAGKTQGSHCSTCGETIQKQETVPALGHRWDTEFTVDKPATTKEPGWQSIHCRRCDATKDGKEIPRLEDTHTHTPVTVAAVSAGCTTEGKTEGKYCRTCGEVLQEQEIIPALGHDWAEKYTIDKPATTKEPGWQSIHCRRCDETKDGKEIPAIHVHKRVIDQAVPVSCTEEGKTLGSHCGTCGMILQEQEVIPARGHDWDSEYTFDKAATTEEPGWKSIHCGRCDETKDGQEIPRIEADHIHTVVEDAEIPATCTKNGRTQGSHCNTCGGIIQEPQVIPAGHDWEDDYTEDIPATETAEGQCSIHCRNCDEIKDVQPIPALEEQKTDISPYYILIVDDEEFVYDGQEKCPDITVENEDTVLSPLDYQVEYSQNIHAGTAKITVTGTGDYTGTITETFEILKADNEISAAARYTRTAKTSVQTFKLNVRAKGGSLSFGSNSTKVNADKNGKVTIQKNFVGKAVITVRAGDGDYEEVSARITITVNPAGTGLTKVKNVSGRKMSVKWKKNSRVSGYQIQYAVNRKFSGAKSKNISGSSKTGATIKGLKKKKTYYVRIRTYKTVAGVRYYSSWSKAQKKVKISK